MPAYNTVLFDLDGTFADTAPDLGAALNRVLAEEGRPPVPHEVFRPHTSAGTRGMLGIGFGIKPEHPDYPALAERFLAHYSAALCVGTVLFEGMEALLQGLESRGHAWGIVTNKPERYTLPLMDALGYATRAACIVSGDSAPRPKPEPDLLFLACQLARREPARCLYLGDDLRDIQAGRAAGMTTVAVTWGYMGCDVPVEAWGADVIIDHPREILKLV